MSQLKIRGLTVNGLQPIDLALAEKECVVISGASGSGKSLLLKAIADLIPHQGDVWLGETACSQIPAHQWRRQVGMLAAESQWWSERIIDHIAEPDMELLPQLGLTTEALQWEVARCSTGEKQRLALLRLLSQHPKVLLLDEPTASLDHKSVLLVEQLVASYQQQYAAIVIWVSHDDAQVKRVATRHFHIEAGCLQAVMS